MLADKIYAAFDEVCYRNTRPRRLIAERLIELAAVEPTSRLTISGKNCDRKILVWTSDGLPLGGETGQYRLVDRMSLPMHAPLPGLRWQSSPSLDCTQCHRV